MKRHTSYGNFMKEQAQNRQKKAEQFYLSLAAQLILDESVHSENKKRLMRKIDEALIHNKQDDFIKLSNHYKKLC